MATPVAVNEERSPMHMRGRWKAALGAVVASAALVLTGCSAGARPDAADDGEKPVVLTTFTVLEDIAENVAGDHLVVSRSRSLARRSTGTSRRRETSGRPRMPT